MQKYLLCALALLVNTSLQGSYCAEITLPADHPLTESVIRHSLELLYDTVEENYLGLPNNDDLRCCDEELWSPSAVSYQLPFALDVKEDEDSFFINLNFHTLDTSGVFVTQFSDHIKVTVNNENSSTTMVIDEYNFWVNTIEKCIDEDNSRTCENSHRETLPTAVAIENARVTDYKEHGQIMIDLPKRRIIQPRRWSQ